MFRTLSILAVLTAATATPALAQTAKVEDCGYQSDVVAAVQAARIERVKEREVAEHVAQTSPEWPEQYNAVIPLVAPWIYQMKRSEVKTADLKSAWTELCLAQ